MPSNALIPACFLPTPLGCLDVHPGTRLANIGNMPDVQLSPAPRNAFDSALRLPKGRQERVSQWTVENVEFTEFVVQG